jgi:hypothetical protein
MPSLTLCEQGETSSELFELRNLIEEYDSLFELCMTQALDQEDQKFLDSLYFELMVKEHSYWEGTSERILNMFRQLTDIDFPMIRYQLGMLPNMKELRRNK